MSDTDERIDAVFGQAMTYLGDLAGAYHALLTAYRQSGRRVAQLERDNAHLRERLERALAGVVNERRAAHAMPQKKLDDLTGGR